MADTQPLGTWHIQSWTVHYDDGSSDTPFGPRPTGYLHYAANGMMFAQFMGQGGHIAYAGPYRVTGDTVHHQVTVCSRAELVGTDLMRRFRIDGDTLTIDVDRTTFGPRQGSAVLIWTRHRPTKG